MLKRAARYREVERILVNPGIKKQLCETVKGDRSWLRKIRPFWGHDYHFHVRIGCQPGSSGCRKQAVTAEGEGCDKSLAWWFTEEPWRPNQNPDAPKARDLMTMASLPKECRAVLNAPAPVSEAAVTVGPGADAMAVARAETSGATASEPDTDVAVAPETPHGCELHSAQRLCRHAGNGRSPAARHVRTSDSLAVRCRTRLFQRRIPVYERSIGLGRGGWSAGFQNAKNAAGAHRA